MAETLLAPRRLASVGTVDTGTVATSGSSGNSSPSRRYRRKAPVHTARTTSLSVVSQARLMRLASSREMEEKATRRCGVMAALSEVRGVVRGSAARPCPRARTRRTSSRARPVRQASFVIPRGRVRRVPSDWATSWRSDGRCSSTDTGASGAGRAGGSGSRSKSWDSNSAPETPSMVQWWILVTTAI